MITTVAEAADEWVFSGRTSAIEGGGVHTCFKEVSEF